MSKALSEIREMILFSPIVENKKIYFENKIIM